MEILSWGKSQIRHELLFFWTISIPTQEGRSNIFLYSRCTQVKIESWAFDGRFQVRSCGKKAMENLVVVITNSFGTFGLSRFVNNKNIGNKDSELGCQREFPLKKEEAEPLLFEHLFFWNMFKKERFFHFFTKKKLSQILSKSNLNIFSNMNGLSLFLLLGFFCSPIRLKIQIFEQPMNTILTICFVSYKLKNLSEKFSGKSPLQ